MALHFLIIENEERRCLMEERLLEDPEDVLMTKHISNYRMAHNMTLQLAQEVHQHSVVFRAQQSVTEH